MRAILPIHPIRLVCLSSDLFPSLLKHFIRVDDFRWFSSKDSSLRSSKYSKENTRSIRFPRTVSCADYMWRSFSNSENKWKRDRLTDQTAELLTWVDKNISWWRRVFSVEMKWLVCLAIPRTFSYERLNEWTTLIVIQPEIDVQILFQWWIKMSHQFFIYFIQRFFIICSGLINDAFLLALFTSTWHISAAA